MSREQQKECPDTVRANKVRGRDRGDDDEEERVNKVLPKNHTWMGYTNPTQALATQWKKYRKGNDPDERSTFGTEEPSIAPTEHVSSDSKGKGGRRKRRQSRLKRRTKSRKQRRSRKSSRRHRKTRRTKRTKRTKRNARR
jgi:hypothetical protein